MDDTILLPQRRPLRWGVLAAMGPGILVMLADTDAGSIITAAESGARWGYRLLGLQLLLVPILYVVQELALRLGVVTGRGYGELVRREFGRFWGWLAAAALVIACLGALVTELSGMAGVGALFGVPVWLTTALSAGTIMALVWSGSYRSVERWALAIGAFELAFLWIAFAAHPEPAAMAQGFVQLPLGDHDFLYLATANIGAVIMPWMIFYQQSAVVEKGLTRADLPAARRETAVGAVVTQLIMAAALVAVAATIGRSKPDASLATVQQISDSLTPFLGPALGRVVFALAMSGSALVATVVVALTAAWGVGEIAGTRRGAGVGAKRHSAWFNGVFGGLLGASALLVATGVDLVELSVAVEVLNALLLPLVLGLLFCLARRTLPESERLKGRSAVAVGLTLLLTAGFGLYAGVAGFAA